MAPSQAPSDHSPCFELILVFLSPVADAVAEAPDNPTAGDEPA